jgi:uncharacterized protein (DUF305 family)
MNRIFTKTSTLPLSLLAIAASSNILLTACSDTSRTKAQSISPSPSMGEMKGMEHGTGEKKDGMSHSMSMDLGPADANFDLRFIDGMTPHHEGAVVMAKEAVQKSKRPEIKTLAAQIIKSQNIDIAEMKQWRKTWYPKASNSLMAWSSEMGHMMSMKPEQKQRMMMSQNLGAADTEFDLRFINAMLPHHEGALKMAKEAQQKSRRNEVKQLATNILTSQQVEIQQMKQWRKAWYQQ